MKMKAIAHAVVGSWAIVLGFAVIPERPGTGLAVVVLGVLQICIALSNPRSPECPRAK